MTRIPKYQIVENEIIDRINSGIYQINCTLPTESELAEMFSCSRVTVRQALDNLEHKKFIIKGQGTRTIVNHSSTIQSTPLIKGFSQDMRESGRVPTSKVKTFMIVEANNIVANILGIKPKSNVYYIERIRKADGVPIVYEKTYMSVDLHPEMSVKILKDSKYKYGDTHGLRVCKCHQNISPIFPFDDICIELNINPNTPILRIQNTSFLDDGRVFDYTELYPHPEFYKLNIVKVRPNEQ